MDSPKSSSFFPTTETQRANLPGLSLPPAGPILIELFTFIDLNIHFVCILGWNQKKWEHAKGVKRKQNPRGRRPACPGCRPKPSSVSSLLGWPALLRPLPLVLHSLTNHHFSSITHCFHSNKHFSVIEIHLPTAFPFNIHQTHPPHLSYPFYFTSNNIILILQIHFLKYLNSIRIISQRCCLSRTHLLLPTPPAHTTFTRFCHPKKHIKLLHYIVNVFWSVRDLRNDVQGLGERSLLTSPDSWGRWSPHAPLSAGGFWGISP